MLRQGHQSAYFLRKGWELVWQPGLRRFVMIPLLINLILFGAGFGYLLVKFDEFLAWSHAHVPGWVATLMDSLSWLIWPLVVVTMLLAGSYIFSMMANWIGAPFNGLLAEAVEARLTGRRPPQESMHRMMVRTFGREWIKLKYYLPKSLAMALLWLLTFYIPGLNLLFPVLWFVFSAWMMALQYIDYPMDNHQTPFPVMLAALRKKRRLSWGFGALVTLLGMLPLVNLLVMPVAVAGATVLWVEEFLENESSSARLS